MPEWIEILSAVDGGIITTEAAREAGVSPRTIQRAVVEGVLVRVRRGAYVLRGLWDNSRPGQRHRMLVIATQRLSPVPLVVSHLSAAAMFDLPTIGPWPTTVHVLAPGAAGGASARYLTAHRGAEADTVVIDGVEVTSLARTLVDVAATETMVRSVTVIDAALRAASSGEGASAAKHRLAGGWPGLTAEHLLLQLDDPDRRYGLRQAEEAISFANPLSENPGESLSRVRLFQLGFEVPELQVRFSGANNGSDAVVDYWWRARRKAGEFDGKHKYTRGAFAADDVALGDVVFAEKRREDALRRGPVDSMARWVWDEVIVPATFYRLMCEYDVPLARRAA